MAGMIHGSRISLSIGFVAVGIAVVIGVVLGAIAGYFGSWIDLVISRLFEVMLSIPTFFLLITIAALLPPSIFLTMLIIGATSWVGIARFTRNEFLRIRTQDYVTSAIALGVTDRKVMFKHILPNALAPVIVSVVLGIAGAILVESSLSFLGIGVPAELVTWGSILHEASTHHLRLVARRLSRFRHLHYRARVLPRRRRFARSARSAPAGLALVEPFLLSRSQLF